MLYREKWKFYDFNMDAVKEVMAQPGFIDFASGLDKEDYAEYEKDLNLLKGYIKR